MKKDKKLEKLTEKRQNWGTPQEVNQSLGVNQF